MRRKPPEIKFDLELDAELEAIKAKVGQPVPLSMWYVLGAKGTLESIRDGFATIVFPNGARLERVPIRDLVDDKGYWKR